jgi:hypothetical protein
MRTSIWHVFDLAAGLAVIVCFFPDVVDGLAHAYKGMYEVVEIAA